MKNQSNSKEKSKAPRITNDQMREIVDFFRSYEDNKDLTLDEKYKLTIETYHEKWGKEYNITDVKLNSWIRICEEGGAILREKSLLPLYIFEILRQYSSPENPMTESQIKEKVNEYYKNINRPELKIEDNDRKIIPRHADGLVSALRNDLIKKMDTPRNKPSKWYYNNNPTSSYGVLTQINGKSDFSLGEMAFLIDMVKDSRVISSVCTNALIHKLVAAVDETERQNLVLPKNNNDASKPIIKKSDNKRYLEFNDILEQAIKDTKKVTIYDMDENGMDVTPIKIVHHSEDDKYCLVAVDENHQPQKYLFEDIWDIGDLDEDGDYPDGFDLDDKRESENFKRNKAIALDTLFFNMREINHAIKESKYLSFAYLSCKVQLTKRGGTEFTYEQSPVKTLAPLKTLYKDGKPYLITVDPENDYKPEFFRVDLMQDIRSHGNVDFMGRYGVKKLQGCEDNHPYPDLLQREFKEITAKFDIHKDGIERVIDAFGDKATYCSSKKGWELGSDKIRKLTKFNRDFNFSQYLGLDHNATYYVFEVKTTAEEIKRFGLEHADVAEIEEPAYIRDEIKALAEAMIKRYNKKKD